MVNILWSFLYLLITFGITLLTYRYFGRVGLFIWICLSIVVTNIQSVKIIEVFGLTTALGNIAYSNIYLATDIISEKYGKKSANTSVLFGFLTMLVFTMLMSLSLLFKPGEFDVSQSSLIKIFTVVPRITLASVLAYVCSQFLDIFIYDKLKKKYNKLWISNNVGTITSQIVDTIIFVIIAYVGTMPFKEIIIMMLTMYLLKVIIALLDTGYIYIAKKIKARELVLDKENQEKE